MNWLGVLVTFVLCYLSLMASAGGPWLDNFVSYYEVYEATPVANAMRARLRRSAPLEDSRHDILYYPVHAFNRSFVLVLQPDNSILGSNHFVEFADDAGNMFKPQLIIVKGYVEGVGASRSRVYGSIINGRFEGEFTLVDEDETYLVENAEKFTATADAVATAARIGGLSSVVYRSSDVVLKRKEHGDDAADSLSSNRKRRSADSGGDYSFCGLSHANVESTLLRHQQDATLSDIHDEHDHHGESAWWRYSRDANFDEKKRQRRAAAQPQQTGTVNSSVQLRPKVCGLFLQADHLLFERYIRQVASTTNNGANGASGGNPAASTGNNGNGKSSSNGANANINLEEQAAANIVAYFAYVATKANDIYSKTAWTTRHGDVGPYSNVFLRVMRTKIYRSKEQFMSTFQVRQTEMASFMNLDSTNFLNLISRQDYSGYCAAYVFTLRDFSSGVLGLAWIGYPDAIQRGGVCDRYGATRSGRQSLNTGIVTLLNYGQLVNRLVSAITFAHELGHNFGAQHDNTPADGQPADPECFPGGDDGNFIMYSSATSGLKPNNEKFSTCSKDSISRNLDAILRGMAQKFNCFRESNEPFCGNGVVEGNEQCDCGFKEECGLDARCCGPADSDHACRFLNGASCSRSNGPCCDIQRCMPTSQPRLLCRQADECNRASYCDGRLAICPNGNAEIDGKLCANKTKICIRGECSQSSCINIKTNEQHPYSGCQTEKPAGQTRYNKSELCFLSCKSPKTGQCFNSLRYGDSEFDEEFSTFLRENNNGQPIQLLAGSPCDNDRGYCDVFRRCRQINAEGPLARLKDMLFSVQTMTTLQAWVEAHWWAVVLIGVGVITIMAVFIKVCSVHTPSSNPRLPRHRTVIETLRRATGSKPIVYIVRQGGGGHVAVPAAAPPQAAAQPNRGGPPQGRGPGHRRPLQVALPPEDPNKRRRSSSQQQSQQNRVNSGAGNSHPLQASQPIIPSAPTLPTELEQQYRRGYISLQPPPSYHETVA